MKQILKFTGVYIFLSILAAIIMFVSGFDFEFMNRSGDGYQFVYFVLQAGVTVLTMLCTVLRDRK